MAGESAALNRLPASAVASLRAAFADELATRLPRMKEAAAGRLELLDLRDLLRDAHSLGSSAAVVGEAEASRAARELEVLLADEELAGVADAAAKVVSALEGWAA